MSEQSRSATTTADTPRSSAEAPSDLKEAHDLLIRGFRLMENWNDAEASAIIAPNYTNAEASPEPPPARAPGIAGVRATLRLAAHSIRGPALDTPHCRRRRRVGRGTDNHVRPTVGPLRHLHP
jgi:hypothetical protein